MSTRHGDTKAFREKSESATQSQELRERERERERERKWAGHCEKKKKTSNRVPKQMAHEMDSKRKEKRREEEEERETRRVVKVRAEGERSATFSLSFLSFSLTDYCY